MVTDQRVADILNFLIAKYKFQPFVESEIKDVTAEEFSYIGSLGLFNNLSQPARAQLWKNKTNRWLNEFEKDKANMETQARIAKTLENMFTINVLSMLISVVSTAAALAIVFWTYLR